MFFKSVTYIKPQQRFSVFSPVMMDDDDAGFQVRYNLDTREADYSFVDKEHTSEDLVLTKENIKDLAEFYNEVFKDES
jgi:hypothetical protein